MTADSSLTDLAGFLARHEPVSRPKLLAVGATVDEWRVTAFLGSGGNAEVYRVSGKSVAALKVLAKDDAASRARFAQETRLLAEHLSPALPCLFDSGEIGGRPYLIMELLEPVDLPSGDAAVADYVLAVCRAVAALHHAGLVHRDIKPSNVMRRTNGELVLIDLGLAKDRAKSTEPEKGVSIVSSKVVAVGTPRFAAPEQMTGGEITAAADIHAIGRLADMAFGSNPPRAWLPIIRRATSSIPERRYATVEELMWAIRRRKRPYRLAVIGVAGAVVGCLWLGGTMGTDGKNKGVDESAVWLSLVTPVTTNVVVRQLVWERVATNRFDGAQIVFPERKYQAVTNRVAALRIALHGTTNVFARPIVLDAAHEYFIEGPGILSADFRTDGGSVRVHVDNCSVVNRSKVPLDKVGIRYAMGRGAHLNFTELGKPSGAIFETCFEDFDGAYGEIRFKDSLSKEDFERYVRPHFL